MKAKILLIALGAVLATGIIGHLTHEPPKDGKCPLQSALNSGN